MGLNFLKLLQAALHLAGFPGFVAKALHEAHLPLDLAAPLPGRSRLFDLKGALMGDEVVVIVASQEHHLVGLNGQHPGLLHGSGMPGRER